MRHQLSNQTKSFWNLSKKKILKKMTSNIMRNKIIHNLESVDMTIIIKNSLGFINIKMSLKLKAVKEPVLGKIKLTKKTSQ
jgi:hypothetical protein